MIVDKGIHIGRMARFNAPALTILLTYDICVTVAYMVLDWHWASIPNLPLPLLGSAIALIVTLRNNAAYARWWEARTLWGAVVNNSRSLARGVLALADDPAFRHDLIRSQIAYVLALRCHLLRLPSDAALAQYLPEDAATACKAAANVPAAVQIAMAQRLTAARAAGILDNIATSALDRTLSAVTDAQGGLERIKNTPLPRQFSGLPRLVIRAYCILLPLGLVDNLGYATVLGSGLVGFIFLLLDEIGRDLEDPFSNDIHDIPMAAITRTIEIDLLQAIGSSEVPPPITPQAGILW